MKVVYRMRGTEALIFLSFTARGGHQLNFNSLCFSGLLGDATEDIVEQLDKNNRKFLRYHNNYDVI